MTSNFVITLIVILMVIVIFFFLFGLRIIKQYERVMIFRFGRMKGIKGPGVFWIIPFVDKTILIDTRAQVIEIPRQEVITKDNVPVMINAIAYFHILDPEKTTISITDLYQSTFQIAQTTIRSVLGRVELDEALTERDKLNREIRAILDEAVHEWGVNITRVEIKDLKYSDSMKHYSSN